MDDLPPLTEAERGEFEAWKGRFDADAAAELFEERAAIMEYEGNLDRPTAEALAMLDVVRSI